MPDGFAEDRDYRLGGAGVPPEDVFGRPVDAADQIEWNKVETGPEVADDLESEASLRLEVLGFASPSTLAAVLTGVSALLGLFAFAQTASTLAVLTQLPWLLSPLVTAFLAVLVVLVLYAVWRLAAVLWGLKLNRPLPYDRLAELAHRARLRKWVLARQTQAIKALRQHVKRYPAGAGSARPTGLHQRPSQWASNSV